MIFIDRMMRAWHAYIDQPGDQRAADQATLPGTPKLKGDFWIQTTDMLTHLLLPTITLMLISLATHSRFARASMLEVMNQDYIRTARSKGLTERTVIMRHAFRNALIPIATVDRVRHRRGWSAVRSSPRPCSDGRRWASCSRTA